MENEFKGVAMRCTWGQYRIIIKRRLLDFGIKLSGDQVEDGSERYPYLVFDGVDLTFSISNLKNEGFKQVNTPSDFIQAVKEAKGIESKESEPVNQQSEPPIPNEWVSVKDRLPPKYEIGNFTKYLVKTRGGFGEANFGNSGLMNEPHQFWYPIRNFKGEIHLDGENEITHWSILPQPPKQD